MVKIALYEIFSLLVLVASILIHRPSTLSEKEKGFVETSETKSQFNDAADDSDDDNDSDEEDDDEEWDEED